MVDLSPQNLSLPVGKPRVAVLVDGENLSSSHASVVLAVAHTLGYPTIRRVYGKPEQIEAWGNEGFRLMATRSGKNAADLLLCVEAMTFALREEFQILVIASSDRDFTCLAEHLRELGHVVIGLGESKTPVTFRAACEMFRELDHTVDFTYKSTEASPKQAKTNPSVSLAKPPAVPTKKASIPQPKTDIAIRDAIFAEGKDNRIAVQRLGTLMGQKQTKAKSTGCATWTKYLAKNTELYRLEGQAAARTVLWLGPTPATHTSP